MEHPLLYTPEQAAGLLQVGRTTMYGLLATGEVESIKISRARRIPADALEAYVARQRGQAREEAVA